MTEFGPVRQLGHVTQYEVKDRHSLTDYLAFQDQVGRSFLVADIRRRPPCQFIRRRIAEHFNLYHWNWESALSETRTSNSILPSCSLAVCPTHAVAPPAALI